MTAIQEIWRKLLAREIPWYGVAIVAGAVVVWIVVTGVAANLAAASQGGQIEAVFILFGDPEKGNLIRMALHPTYLLSGWGWAIAVFWGLPIAGFSYLRGWQETAQAVDA